MTKGNMLLKAAITKTATREVSEVINRIARINFEIATLETRNSDRLDFHDVAIWNLKKALEDAYEAGRNAALKGE